MEKTKKLAQKIFGGVKSFGLVEGKVTSLSPLTVTVAATRLRKGHELTVCVLPRELSINDKVLIRFNEDNTRAYLMGVIAV